MQDVTLQVGEAIELINQTLDAAFPFILVEGEVASFKVNQGKFVFFDLKDSEGSLGCFMMAFSLKFPIEDGMKVRVLAQPKITNWGKFSLTIREVMPVGEGSLKKSFEILKSKLQAEGLFDEARKRPLPRFPVRIGVVSSSGAAGYADFIKILNNRWGGLSIVLTDVTVQGMDAPGQIVGAINHLNELAEPLDVIAIIRGGGSADDLAAFNHEDVVRAVASSRTPTIVGVGHEVDISLVDLASDVRAATPSNAAELLVPDKSEILHHAERIATTAGNGVQAAIRVFEEDLENVQTAINRSLDIYFERQLSTLSSIRRTLGQLDPNQVLRRGYSLVRKGDTPVSSISNVTIGDDIAVQFQDGEAKAKVTHVSST